MDENKIRQIMREEISRALKILALEADNADGYETGELKSAGLGAVRDSAESTARSVLETYHGYPCSHDYGGYCGRQCETNWDGEDN